MATAFELLGLDPADMEVIEANEDFDDLADFVRTLVQIRKEKGIKQKDLAKAMGTSQSVVSDLERVGGNPTVRSLQRYVRALGCRLGLRVRHEFGWQDAATFHAAKSPIAVSNARNVRPARDTFGKWDLALAA